MLHAYSQCLHLALALHTGEGSCVVTVSDRARRLPFFAVLSTGSVIEKLLAHQTKPKVHDSTTDFDTLGIVHLNQAMDQDIPEANSAKHTHEIDINEPYAGNGRSLAAVKAPTLVLLQPLHRLWVE